MAKRDALGKYRYWFEGSSSTLLKGDVNINTGTQSYWYNGSTNEYLIGVTLKAKPRFFAVLIGF